MPLSYPVPLCLRSLPGRGTAAQGSNAGASGRVSLAGSAGRDDERHAELKGFERRRHSVSGLNRLSATAMARQLATREITAVSLLRDCLERIAEREPAVHAWTFIDGDAAMERARMLDAQAASGVLHGLPIAVKDLLDTFDMPTCYGSPLYANHRP